MNKIRSAVIAGLLLGAALLVPAERANAHAVYSSYGDVFNGGFFFFHQAPDLGAFTYVGYDPNGFWTGTTTVVSAAQATYDLRAYDRCNSGVPYATTNWTEVYGPDYWVRGSAACVASGLWQGRCGIRP
jgi:hypothetical protein